MCYAAEIGCCETSSWFERGEFHYNDCIDCIRWGLDTSDQDIRVHHCFDMGAQGEFCTSFSCDDGYFETWRGPRRVWPPPRVKQCECGAFGTYCALPCTADCGYTLTSLGFALRHRERHGI